MKIDEAYSIGGKRPSGAQDLREDGVHRTDAFWILSFGLPATVSAGPAASDKDLSEAGD